MPALRSSTASAVQSGRDRSGQKDSCAGVEPGRGRTCHGRRRAAGKLAGARAGRAERLGRGDRATLARRSRGAWNGLACRPRGNPRRHTPPLKPLLIQPAALRDARDAAAWYRERNLEVSERFLTEVQRTFELIERFPATGARVPLVAGRARRLPVDDFPYHVVFEELADRVEVLAVAHDRRRPGYWRR